MTIGIAIPSYAGHINYLKKLLSIISESTVLPNQVSVSISSFDDEIFFDEYPFELIITKTIDRKNPCENRNIAANKLTTDIISLIDCDDIPHVKRLEYILKSFNQGAKAVVHNYFEKSGPDYEWYKTNLDPLNYFHEYIDKIFDNCPFAKNSSIHQDYHCAHISVKKEIFEKIKYNELIGWNVGEDGEYTKQLINHGINISYIGNKLTQYVR